MSNEPYASGVSVVKPNATNLSDGEIPTTGNFPVSHWAARFGIETKRFREWIRDYHIPYYKPGNEMIVAAPDFWAHAPYFPNRPPVEDSVNGEASKR